MRGQHEGSHLCRGEGAAGAALSSSSWRVPTACQVEGGVARARVETWQQAGLEGLGTLAGGGPAKTQKHQKCGKWSYSHEFFQNDIGIFFLIIKVIHAAVGIFDNENLLTCY